MKTVKELFKTWKIGEFWGASSVLDAVFGYGSDPAELIPFTFQRTGENEITAKLLDADKKVLDERLIWNGAPVWDALKNKHAKEKALSNVAAAEHRLSMWDTYREVSNKRSVTEW